MALLQTTAAAVLLLIFPTRSVVQARVVIGYELSRETSQHGPVVFRYTVRNSLGQPVSLDLGYDRIGRFTFTLTAPDGSVQKVRPTMRQTDHGSHLNTVELLAFGEYRQTVVLDEWLRFALAGPYVLTVEFDKVTARAGQVETTMDSQPRRITVRPRDEQYLRMRCESMLQNLMSRKTRDEEFLGAVTELAWVRDPAAVPYLERALSADLAPDFFDTLVAIGTPTARDAIQRLTNHPNASVANNAKSALARIKTR